MPYDITFQSLDGTSITLKPATTTARLTINLNQKYHDPHDERFDSIVKSLHYAGFTQCQVEIGDLLFRYIILMEWLHKKPSAVSLDDWVQQETPKAITESERLGEIFIRKATPIFFKHGIIPKFVKWKTWLLQKEYTAAKQYISNKHFDKTSTDFKNMVDKTVELFIKSFLRERPSKSISAIPHDNLVYLATHYILEQITVIGRLMSHAGKSLFISPINTNIVSKALIETIKSVFDEKAEMTFINLQIQQNKSINASIPEPSLKLLQIWESCFNLMRDVDFNVRPMWVAYLNAVAIFDQEKKSLSAVKNTSTPTITYPLYEGWQLIMSGSGTDEQKSKIWYHYVNGLVEGMNWKTVKKAQSSKKQHKEIFHAGNNASGFFINTSQIENENPPTQKKSQQQNQQQTDNTEEDFRAIFIV